MKKSKILAPALAILCLSTAASVTGTVAWFASNNVVTADGLKVKSTLPSSLAINSTIDGTNGVGKETSVSFAAAAVALNPCSTYHGKTEGENPTNLTENGTLYTVLNGGDVDPATGLALTGKTLDFDTAEDASYYTDYAVYIGSVGKALTIGTGGALTMTATFGGTVIASEKAAAINVYAKNDAAISDDPTDTGFITCLNQQKTLWTANHGAWAGAGQAVNISSCVILDAGKTIPVASDTTKALKVLIRFYFDGAAQNSATSTFITTNSVSTQDVTLGLSFSLNRGA